MKKIKHLVFLGLTAVVFWACNSTQSAGAIAHKTEQFEALKELVATKSFTIDVKTAHPMQTQAVTQVTTTLLRNTGNTAGRIDVNGDFVKVMQDSVKGSLSYFGEVQVVSTLNPQDAGIHFQGKPSTYEVTENSKKQYLKIEFDVKGKAESYEVIMTLYPNKKATVFVNSAYRNSIRYDGDIIAIEDRENPKS
ncbi:DUF4251 domain-containing protein [Maribacter sp. ANRC-HE7]|uniref:DUF4251 domain-containing protein n=1 Tax=Maribacter aquimaris TaxID=2737171 RepID=A0ABR7UW84_9FLAO|nr:DUF4251 domain-containing protein [Maribacter aquimaris]MBD0776336.1 DUF4251 domain-containing protein [Maribacter aquimaris]